MYIYYYSCRHQRTTLLGYCDKARASADLRRDALALRFQRNFPDSHTNNEMGDHYSEGFPALSLTRSRDSASSSSEDSHANTPDTSSFSGIGLAVIADEPILKAISAIAQQHLDIDANIPDTGVANMAGLRPFDTLKSWIGGSQKAMAAAHSDEDRVRSLSSPSSSRRGLP